MTEDQMMKLIRDEMRRQNIPDASASQTGMFLLGGFYLNLRELSRAILAGVEVGIPLVDLSKGDKLP